eukprot:6713683-Pyramimonas_sp.AAC.1
MLSNTPIQLQSAVRVMTKASYIQWNGACRTSGGSEVQGYGCSSVSSDNGCMALADAAYPHSFGYMVKKDGTGCRVLGLKSDLALVTATTFTSACLEGGGFMIGESIDYTV